MKNMHLHLRPRLADNPKELWGNDYRSFGEVDPFNKNNFVEGYICQKSTEYYGALIINKINNNPVPAQLIMGTPKMHYPFTQLPTGIRNYRFPSAKMIEIYEKLDGTNIVAFAYTDGINLFYSCKTRLRPFLGTGKFGNFFQMWKEVGTQYWEEVVKIIKENGCNLSFELYGARNRHLITYKNVLDIALLFGVTNTGRILSPTQLHADNIPIVKQFPTIDKDYVYNYRNYQDDMNSSLKKEEDNYFSGTEGTVWYVHLHDGKVLQLKCKPDIIEAIHFSAGAGGLNRNVIIATCWNAFENTDNPTVGFIKKLLIEEFDLEVIENNHYLIEKCLLVVFEEQKFRSDVLEKYHETGLNILLNKTEVMREMSKHFPRNKMQKVYFIIESYA